jgi:hypothetical protein
LNRKYKSSVPLDGLSTAENKPNKKRNTDIKYQVFRFGDPGGIRTPNPLVRSQILYPIELRSQNRGQKYKFTFLVLKIILTIH